VIIGVKQVQVGRKFNDSYNQMHRTRVRALALELAHETGLGWI